jgi:hypothetical protein
MILAYGLEDGPLSTITCLLASVRTVKSLFLFEAMPIFPSMSSYCL